MAGMADRIEAACGLGKGRADELSMHAGSDAIGSERGRTGASVGERARSMGTRIAKRSARGGEGEGPQISDNGEAGEATEVGWSMHSADTEDVRAVDEGERGEREGGRVGTWTGGRGAGGASQGTVRAFAGHK